MGQIEDQPAMGYLADFANRMVRHIPLSLVNDTRLDTVATVERVLIYQCLVLAKSFMAFFPIVLL